MFWLRIGRGLVLAAFVAGASLANTANLNAQTSELVDRSQLRVCSSPSNLPYSNEQGEGFENKIAELIAGELEVPVSYTWFPQTLGFIRNTLDKKKCDIIIGYVATHELLLNSNHYYRTSYVLVHRKGELEGLKNLNDKRLKPLKKGVVAGTPPVTILALNDMLDNMKSFHLMVDRRHFSPMEMMVKEIQSGELDFGLMWGPLGGYFAKEAGDDLVVIPLVNETKGPRLSYRITLGVRRNEKSWKRQLNRIIRRKQDEIHKILRDYGVPLIDEDGKVLQVTEQD